MTTYLIDTSAWIEYVLGSKKGEAVRAILNKNHTIITANCTLAELYVWCTKNDQSFPAIIDMINSKSTQQEITLNLWIEGAHHCSAHRKEKSKFGLIDGILLATQELNSATIVTADNEFRGVSKVIVI